MLQESIWGNRKKLKRNYYSELFAKYKDNRENTWKIINEIISDTENKRKNLSEKLIINNTTVVEKQELLKTLISTLQTLAPQSRI